MSMSNGFLSKEEIDSLLNGSDDSSSNAGVNDNSVNLLSDIEKDLLGEIGNISMGSASTALYQIINQKVNITTPVVSITTLKEIKEISKAKEVNGRRYSGFNLLNESDLKLFKEISDGSYLISGFNNKLLRKKLYEDSGNQKNISKMTRTLAKLRKHGIIKKAARKNNYYLTAKGRRITTSLQLYTGKEILA